MKREKARRDGRTLDELGIGENAVIEKLSDGCPMKRRFTELGICPGEQVENVMRSPLGDPCAYLIRGTLIALRRRDASSVLINK